MGYRMIDLTNPKRRFMSDDKVNWDSVKITEDGGVKWNAPVFEDAVKHPNHYTTGSIEVIDYIQDKDLNFALGNVVKYVSRADHKGNAIEDLKKARQYLDFEIAKRERE
jgi:uncharacterized protein DUF3310